MSNGARSRRDSGGQGRLTNDLLCGMMTTVLFAMTSRVEQSDPPIEDAPQRACRVYVAPSHRDTVRQRVMNSLRLSHRQSPLWRAYCYSGNVVRRSRSRSNSLRLAHNMAPFLATVVPISFAAASCESAVVTAPMRTTNAMTIMQVDPIVTRIINEIKRYWKIIKRMIKLGALLTPMILLSPIMALSSNEIDNDADAHLLALQQEHEATGITAAYLKMCLYLVEHAGAAVIKLTQWASSRPDLFGHDFCAVFTKLQDDTTPHSWKHTQKALREAFGDDYESKIKIDNLLGSGCIGQVYKGQIKNPNTQEWEPVAVKVLHPNVQTDIDADLELMRTTVRLLQTLPFQVFEPMKWLNLEGVVEEFADLLNLQLDLRIEAHNLERFNENFKGHKTIVFPKLIPGYESTKDVLVETFLEGVPVLQYARNNNANQAQLTELCTEAIKAVCKVSTQECSRVLQENA